MNALHYIATLFMLSNPDFYLPVQWSEHDLNHPVNISLELPYCWSRIRECHHPTAAVNN